MFQLPETKLGASLDYTKKKISLGCPASQTFSIWVGVTMAIVSVLAVKITCIKTGVWEH